ncbi:apyrase [Malassezia psittaci]|uniref:Apyrase n=1 Tax=Malassezia psittaci TaxID=1821823 RepID=A0AAF0F6J4_9BASI|nr:apyrase [Malassezia psittaci]
MTDIQKERTVLTSTGDSSLWKRKPIVLPDSQVNADEASWLAHRKYVVVVDAGSSGSRLMVYSWRDAEYEKAWRKERNLHLDVLPTVEKGTWEHSQQAWQTKSEPGISSFAGQTKKLRPYLQDLFSHVQNVIPADAWAQTPVYILATAGMRMLDPFTRKELLEETCSVLHEMPYSIQRDQATEDAETACGGQVRVISGEEEGLLGWIAINYLMDGFNSPSQPSNSHNDYLAGNTTYGFLDMGGASTQIAFEPSQGALEQSTNITAESSTPLQKDLFDVNFRRLDSSAVRHQVFVTTFLGFGTNAARTRYMDSLAGSSPSESPVNDPCLPKNLRMNHESVGEVIGSGSFTQCLALQQSLLDRDAECNRPPCLFHGVHVPTIDFESNQFIGVSEYWYSAHDVFDLGGAYDYSTYQQAAQEFCSEDWNDLQWKLSQNHYKEQVTLPRLQMQCFKAAWVITVLHEGLRLPRLGKGDARWNATEDTDELREKVSDKNLFQSVNDVDGVSVSWALGKAVLEASQQISSDPCTNCTSMDQAAASSAIPGTAQLSSLSTATSWLPVFFVVMLLGGGLMLWRIVKRKDRPTWTPLPTSDNFHDKSNVRASVVTNEDAWSDVTDSSEQIPLHTRRSLKRKHTRRSRRSVFSKVLQHTTDYAQHQLKRWVKPENSGSHRKAKSLLSVEVVPDYRSEQIRELSAYDISSRLPRSSTPATSREAIGSPHAPSYAPARTPSSLSPGYLSRSMSPTCDGRSDLSSMDRIPSLSPAAIASGTLYASRPPSRGPSPMMLESRRPSLVPTISSSSCARLSPIDPRPRSANELRSPHPSSSQPFDESE